MSEFFMAIASAAIEAFATFYAGTAAEHIARRHWEEAPKPKRRRATKRPARRSTR